MRKYFFMMSLMLGLVVSGMLFVSCGDDEEPTLATEQGDKGGEQGGNGDSNDENGGNSGNQTDEDKSGVIDGREYVDLGLPSGTLWATMNVGASKPEDYGDYFAWGETVPYGGEDNSNAMNYAYAGTYVKTYYDWSTYKYCKGSYSTLIKYCNNSSYGFNGYTDELGELLPEDDAATANWSAAWRIPSNSQFSELLNGNYTMAEFTKLNGVSGCKITSIKNGNSIFLPVTGIVRNANIERQGENGQYWARTYSISKAYRANGLELTPTYHNDDIGISRCSGCSVRPVRNL